MVRFFSDILRSHSDNNTERIDNMNGKRSRAGDGTKIYYPKSPATPEKEILAPMWETNVITDNKTDENGNVVNISDMNVIDAKKWVDANHK